MKCQSQFLGKIAPVCNLLTLPIEYCSNLVKIKYLGVTTMIDFSQYTYIGIICTRAKRTLVLPRMKLFTLQKSFMVPGRGQRSSTKIQ